MKFVWSDYTDSCSPLIDSWLDDEAVKKTGIDEGWQDYWSAVVADSVNYPGCKDFCKIVSENGVPFAVIVFGFYCGEVTVSEIIVDPSQRNKGKGTQALKEFIEYSGVFIGEKFEKISAVIFPSNSASQRAFEKAGFSFDRAHEDGDAWYYTYKI